MSDRRHQLMMRYARLLMAALRETDDVNLALTAVEIAVEDIMSEPAGKLPDGSSERSYPGGPSGNFPAGLAKLCPTWQSSPLAGFFFGIENGIAALELEEWRRRPLGYRATDVTPEVLPVGVLVQLHHGKGSGNLASAIDHTPENKPTAAKVGKSKGRLARLSRAWRRLKASRIRPDHTVNPETQHG
jgi:hypothetical protein